MCVQCACSYENIAWLKTLKIKKKTENAKVEKAMK